jgi:uroporphyrinogen decarboxylase
MEGTVTSRERMLTTLQGGVPDRIGRCDTVWSETLARWREEGLGAEEDIARKFGFDVTAVSGPDLSFRFPTEIVEEAEEWTIQWDANGVLRKDFTRESGHTPHWMDHRINTREDWEQHRERLIWSDDRVRQHAQQAYEGARERGLFICFESVEAYEAAWPVFGQVGIFTHMMDDPALVAEVFEVYTDLIIAGANRMLEMGIDFDGMWTYGDLGYRNSTLFSPKVYDDLLFPQHRRMCEFFNARGKPVILHSCGRIQELIPRFIEAGFSAIQPLEAKAGQDVRELKKEYGKDITFVGNIDVRKMSATREELREELLSKLEVAMQGGGYIYHSDHSVPPTVSWGNYCYLMELLEEHGVY